MLTYWFIGLFGCLCGEISAFTKQEWEMQVDETNKKLKEYVDTGNYGEELLKVYTDTIRFGRPRYPAAIGKAELREYFKMRKSSWKKHSTEITDKTIVACTPEVAVVWMDFTIRITDEGNRVSGKDIQMLRKVHEEAKIDVQIWNFDSQTMY